MADAVREDDCYFDLPRRQNHASSDTARSISPLSDPVLNIRRPRPISYTGVKSGADYATPRLRAVVATIDEERSAISEPLPRATGHVVEDEGEAERRTDKSDSSDRGLQNATDTTLGRGYALARSISASPPYTRNVESRHMAKLERPSWSRSISGSVFLERMTHVRGTSSSNNSGSTPIRIEALKPPSLPIPKIEDPMLEHKIRVETPFDVEEIRSETSSVHSLKQSSRRTSLDPRQIFYMPLKAVRSLGRTRKKLHPPSLPTVGSKSFQRVQDHRSGWRKNDTAFSLPRVTSLLSDLYLTKSVSGQTSTQSKSSTGSRFLNIAGLKSKADRSRRVERVNSMGLGEITESESSTMINLRMGVVPPNTPDEHATYRIKRSASAETEEFLKIDISIRGRTSYLPSEARRIHTPPLPKEGLDGKQRGFFFDYDAARAGAAFDTNSEVFHDAHSACKYEALTEKAGQSNDFPCGSGNGGKGKPRDWFETQLVYLDSSEDGSREHSKRPAMQTAAMSIGSQADKPKKGKKVMDEQYDFSVPEHLPTSPLCPRHPRYWRVIKGKGSQFRGCWMHGFGVYRTSEQAGDGVA